MKKTVLILLYASCYFTFSYNNYIYALAEEDKINVLNFITHINNINLKEGLGASVSYAVDENIRAYARSSGLNESYWALRAIDKKLVESGDVIAKKFASSIELLKKIIAGCFYQKDIYATIDYYAEYTINSIAKIINNYRLSNVNWYNSTEIKQHIFSLINSINVVKGVAHSIINKRQQLGRENYYWNVSSESAYRLFMDTTKRQKLANGKSNVYTELLKCFNNDEKNMESYLKHDFDCYLNQFKVLCYIEYQPGENDDHSTETVIGRIKQMAFRIANLSNGAWNHINYKPLYEFQAFAEKVYPDNQNFKNFTLSQKQNEMWKIFNQASEWYIKRLENESYIVSLFEGVNRAIKDQNDKIWHNLADLDYLQIIYKYGYFSDLKQHSNKSLFDTTLKGVTDDIVTIFSQVWSEIATISGEIQVNEIKKLSPKILLRVMAFIAFPEDSTATLPLYADDNKRRNWFNNIKMFLTTIYKACYTYKIKNVNSRTLYNLWVEFGQATDEHAYLNVIVKMLSCNKEKNFTEIILHFLENAKK